MVDIRRSINQKRAGKQVVANADGTPGNRAARRQRTKASNQTLKLGRTELKIVK